MAKRLMDITLAGLGLLLLSPLMAAIALAIKLEDGGPAFYCGERVGQGGSHFRMLKFRSMVEEADRTGGPLVAEDDPRVTGIGRLLRKSKLDELPQLINVLLGEMSVVGPRPEVPELVQLYSPEELAILAVRPGITDWASLYYHDEAAALARHGAEPDQAYQTVVRPSKVRLQLLYADERSFRTDCQILGLTLLRVLGWERLPGRVREVAEQPVSDR